MKAEIEKLGRRSEVFVLDILKIREIEGLRDFILERFGKVRYRQQCGVRLHQTRLGRNRGRMECDDGYRVERPLLLLSDHRFLMREHGYGKIINLSSTFSRSIVPNRAVYAAVKAGISHLTEALALEWAPHGIRVNALAPTAVLTPSRADILKGDFLKKILARIPLGGLATPRGPYGCGHLSFQPGVRLCHRPHPLHRWRLGSCQLIH